MDRVEALTLVRQNLDQALVLLDELGEVLAAAKLQGVIDALDNHSTKPRVAKKPTDGRSDHDHL